MSFSQLRSPFFSNRPIAGPVTMTSVGASAGAATVTGLSVGGNTAALTGTALSGTTEADIVAGGRTIIITLAGGDSFIPN